MNGSCRRLLAAFSLILLGSTLSSMVLHGQDAASNLPALRNSPPFAPVPIGIAGPPTLPWRYPAGRGSGGVQQRVLQQLVRAAGIIFSGSVTSVGRASASPGLGPAATTVTFQVEHAMRGAAPGQNLTIHEWAGLWTTGERYSVGERVLLFLYSPGKLGLTSPVAGAMGRFVVDSRGWIVMNPQHFANLRAEPILGGKTLVPYADFALAVGRSSGEE
jgi:hypothetical protein